MEIQTNSDANESLFSLELVVEKLYIPHTPCRFPAVAFRLLDFPTILIKHVEDDLGTAIRNKISFDPYYKVPEQFAELKDKHGNFMLRKGKSCLFKINPNLLKQHLATTPLYVMVIEMFSEVPKLIGNSSVPLNALMDSICLDIAKLGSTVPSVHGDKGLFKLYNLMGKEIGYFVLGFRVLCLGPSLISHLPDSALMQRQIKGKQAKADRAVEKMLDTTNKNAADEEKSQDVLLRNSACMTDPIRHDVLLQTVDVEDKSIHVVTSNADMETNTVLQPGKESQTASTQTEKHKQMKEILNSRNKWFQYKDSENDVIMNNIVCPPPLFYNSKANPQVEIQNKKIESAPFDEEMSIEDLDLSDLDSFDGVGIKQSRVKDSSVKYSSSIQTIQGKTQARYVPQSRQGEYIKGLQVAPEPGMVFPLLTALVNELACVQNPQFLLDISNKIQSKDYHQGLPKPTEPKTDMVNPSIVSAVATALANKTRSPGGKPSKSESSNVMAQQQPQSVKSHPQAKPDTKSKIIKQAPSAPNKGKLLYKLTTTQRLRLQKTNPKWLEKAERERTQILAPKQPDNQVQPEASDINATNFSDTLTEVRRLAEMELSSTAGGDTLQRVASEAEGMESILTKSSIDRPRHRRRKLSAQRKEQKSTLILNRKSVSPKGKSRSRYSRAERHGGSGKDSSGSDDFMKRKKPVPLDRHLSGMASPAPLDQDQNGAGFEEPLSARSDLPSSRSRSIEVHLPSAEPHGLDDSGSGTITDAEDSHPDEEVADPIDGNGSDEEVDIPLPDGSVGDKPQVQVLNFPRYISREDSLPETIAGAANASLDVSGTLNEDSPLESTRHSQNMLGPERSNSRLLQHSTDLDTRQFHSTDEPELQDLILSEADNHSQSGGGHHTVTETGGTGTTSKFPVINPQLSENSPVPSVCRSTSKLDPGTGHTHSYLPSMSMSKGYTSPVSSRPGTPKSGVAKGNRFDNQPLPGKGSTVVTPRSKLTPRSQGGSPRRPTPRPRRPLRESIHTDSLSSYLPSDPENVLVSLSSSNKSGLSGGNYSDDFNSGDSADVASSIEQLPKIVPSTKLGYTIS